MRAGVERQHCHGDLWDVMHGVRSLVVSAICGIILVAADWLDVEEPPVDRVLLGLGLYLCGLLCTFAGDRRLFRRRQAMLPPDSFAGGRAALGCVALVFCISGDPVAQGLAAWCALAAVLLGGWADGAWLAVVSERRNLGLRQAWLEMGRRERDARRYCWTALFGGRSR